MKKFTTIEKLDRAILYPLELSARISVLFLAFGLVMSMTNMLTLKAAYIHVFIPVEDLIWVRSIAIVLLTLHGTDSLRVSTAGQLHALVFLFLNLHGTGSTIGGIFWGLWLVPTVAGIQVGFPSQVYRCLVDR